MNRFDFFKRTDFSGSVIHPKKEIFLFNLSFTVYSFISWFSFLQ